MHDNNVEYWEIKSLSHVAAFWFRVNTIKLPNNKYETAVFRSNPEGMICDMYIHFYNTHKTEEEAVEFNKTVLDKMNTMVTYQHMGNDFEAVLDKITADVPELSRYKRSVPYEYPTDIFGETYR